MKTPITIIILPWLLHHANRLPSDEFYKIKNNILKKYGKHICYDVQFIEGKKCHTCGGTGIFSKYYDNYGFVSDINYCWNCSGGWYKRPVWHILARVQFGKYTFHQPWQKVYVKPNEDWGRVIEGYIDHEATKYSHFALTVLYLIYRKGYLKTCIRQFLHNKKVRLINFFNRPIQWRESYGPFEYDELPF